ncbi:MAG TPA: NADH-quinone oxidoreductase subunit L [Phycisphaerae bacterium]|nr:NADH-quinone oxidoreductase subunit L [Phycisphaerae bacterium]
MSTYEIALCCGVAVPLAMFCVLAFFGARIGKPASGWLAVGAVGICLALAAYVTFGWLGMSGPARAELAHNAYSFEWVTLTVHGINIPILFKVKLDSLTVMMYFMVTLVSTCIFVFSVGYMAGHSDEVGGQSKYHRFFAYLCLFEFSMLGLVISSSIFFLFVFWELVGLCSYLLIGFYFDKKFASNAAMKAFITNRVGDFGFLAGLMLVLFFLHTLDLDQAAAAFRDQYTHHSGLFGTTVSLFGWQISGITLATFMGVCLFCGAMGKSAQFPLHVWLPDAMAGPTPVSALIHAATMVAAGVYLVARIFRLLTPDAQMFIAVIGCITLTITAFIAIVQTDIKKVLAYSTLSQLGYMIFGMGVGAWIAALFHLITHAFFKAMLFLGSGQVIEGCHHEQDMRKMGGLRHKMPVTCWTFFIGVLAISGFGIPGAGIGIGGYFSKDEILAVAYERAYNWTERFSGQAEHASAGGDELPVRLASDVPDSRTPEENPIDHEVHRDKEEVREEIVESAGHHSPEKDRLAAHVPPIKKWLFWLPIIIAYVTPFYMMRAWWLTFMGKPRDEHVHHHAHESALMYIPLVVLAIGTIVFSYAMFRPNIAEAGVQATDAALVVAVDGVEHTPEMLSITHEPVERSPHHALFWIVGFAWVLGMGFAVLIYRNGFALAERLRRIWPLSWIYVALEQKLFFDHIYDTVLVGGTKWVLAQISRIFDTYIIDGIPNLLGRITVELANFSGRIVDAGGVDGLIDGFADTTQAAGAIMRQPQTGRIRNYILFGTAGAGLVLIGIIIVAYASMK